jgi:hypothetical protein
MRELYGEGLEDTPSVLRWAITLWRALAWLYGVAFFVFWALVMFAPSSPDIRSGRVYSTLSHGHPVYFSADTFAYVQFWNRNIPQIVMGWALYIGLGFVLDVLARHLKVSKSRDRLRE